MSSSRSLRAMKWACATASTSLGPLHHPLWAIIDKFDDLNPDQNLASPRAHCGYHTCTTEMAKFNDRLDIMQRGYEILQIKDPGKEPKCDKVL
eukprot:maker-scaffold304_size215464-snap-gene-1.22 protein:Tk10789 transcript:maker-scaffold304_size215464-snap-gene-1.22-mRNA-1 annotation:"galactose oxidase"